MELGELKVFLTVASERSFSRAAVKLYKTQPAISQAVRRLEEQLGERLFDRTTKHATLTAAGAVLFREGTRLLQLAEETTAAVRRESERERGILRIGGSEVGAHVVLPAISAFLDRHADINVEFHRLSESDVVGELAAGALDVGVVTIERVPSQFQQLRIPMSAGGFTVLVPRAHRLASRREVAAGMLDSERLIVLTDPHLANQMTAGIFGSGERPGSLMGMPGLDSLKRAVEMGLGVGVVPSSVASSLGPHPGLAALRLAAGRSITSLTLVYRGNDAASKSTAEFIEVVRTR